MNAQEAARELGISRSALQRLIADGQLHPITQRNPLLKRPRRLLFYRADVLALKAPVHLDATPGRRLVEDGPGYDPHAA